MISEKAIEVIQHTAVKAAAPVVLRIPGDDRKAFVVSGGEKEVVYLPPEKIDAKFCKLDDLLNFSMTWKQSQIWYRDDEIVAVLDSGDRRDIAKMYIISTGLFGFLASLVLDGGRKLDQKTMIHIVKNKLRFGMDEAEYRNLLTALRSVSFVKLESNSGEQDRARAALGKSIEQTCSGIDKLPEEVRLEVDLFVNLKLSTCPIVVSIDVDFDSQSFRLGIVGDGIANATAAAMDELGSIIRNVAKDHGVYYGSP